MTKQTQQLRANPELRELFLATNREKRKAREMSYEDDLTKLFNRRYMGGALGREIEHAKHGTALSVAFMDIDGFKDIDDTFGHPAGDDVLAQIGSILKGAFRGYDFAVRYGGEEFLIVFPETPEIGAYIASERARKAIESYDFGIGRSVTASFGVAEYSIDTGTAKELISRADQAMYAAKRQGRNRVCAYSAGI